MKRLLAPTLLAPMVLSGLFPGAVAAQDVAVRGEVVHTMAGSMLRDAVVVVIGGKISAIGPAADIQVPAGVRVLAARVVTPGLVDAHSAVGLAGWLNYRHDRDELEASAAVQPELRAIDAYNPREPLVAYLRGYGVTTVHTGHAPGAVISGQTMIAKTWGETVDEVVMRPVAMMAATIGEASLREDGESPGTRSKAVALLRAELVRAREYQAKLDAAEDDDEGEPPARDLRLEALGLVLRREIPLLVTAHRANDILTAMRVAEEFDLRLVLDGAAEAYLVADRILAAGIPVIVHPTMFRARRETENLSLETASKLLAAGIPLALQSGYESYVPRTRVVLFEAGIAAANGLTFEQALGLITIDAARLLGIDDRVGSIEIGKDGDLALYDDDPFEYTSHCIGVVIEGVVVSEERR
ncbi:MAG: amidohydrolase family protein [Planctomycetota bacterium]|nr:amidohydrolase family protein [Planctomycetota bacterium]